MPAAVKVAAKGSPFGDYLPARYLVAVLGCVGMAIVYGLCTNLSVAIVSMVNNTAVEAAQQLGDAGGGNATATPGEQEDGPFVWSRPLQGTILSSYFWGYMVAQLPGGRVAEVFSAKWVFFFSVAINVVCTLLTPAMAKWHHYALIAARIGEGIGGGVTFPAMHVLLAKWAPPSERSVMSSVCYAGTALGTVISMLLSGMLAVSVSWEAVFYVQGALSTVWLVLWWLLTADSPLQQTYISESERDYIVSSLKTNEVKHEKCEAVPWRAIFTSPPFWGILVAHVCSSWGWYMVLIELPYYMKTALRFKMSENAVATAAPFLCLWLFSIVLSKTLDTLRNAGRIGNTASKKIGTAFASAGPMACFVALCFLGERRNVAVFLVTLAVTFCGGAFSGFMSNHIDIAPRFAGTLMAITNTVATLPGIAVPVFVGKLTENDAGIDTWRTIFWATAAFYLVEFAAFTAFGSGEEQEWNRLDEEGDESRPLRTPKTPTKGHRAFDFADVKIVARK